MRNNHTHNATHPAQCRRNTGLSIIEMLIALTISATLLTATLAALDAMFKGYKQTTESASTNLVSRIVMSRLLSMIRTGSGFGPAPAAADMYDDDENPIAADFFEFVSARDADGDPTELVRIEYRVPESFALLNPAWDNPLNRTWSGSDAPPDDTWPAVAGELWFMRIDLTESPPRVTQENPLLSGVRSAVFTMHFKVGPKLTRATVDLLIEPNDSQDITTHTNMEVQTFRLVASAAPRSEN